jgi:hypothetical protein
LYYWIKIKLPAKIVFSIRNLLSRGISPIVK